MYILQQLLLQHLRTPSKTTSLVIHSIHAKLFYARTNSTLTAICQTYWIPTAQQYINALLHQCVVCKGHCGRSSPAPDPATTPKVRTLDVLPSTVTGVDFTGVLYVWHNSGSCTYACLPVPQLMWCTWKLSQIYLLKHFCWHFKDFWVKSYYGRLWYLTKPPHISQPLKNLKPY